MRLVAAAGGVRRRWTHTSRRSWFRAPPVATTSLRGTSCSGLGGTASAVPFNADQLQITGAMTPILTNLPSESLAGGRNPYFAVSSTGSLAFVAGQLPGRGRRWIAPARDRRLAPRYTRRLQPRRIIDAPAPACADATGST